MDIAWTHGVSMVSLAVISRYHGYLKCMFGMCVVLTRPYSFCRNPLHMCCPCSMLKQSKYCIDFILNLISTGIAHPSGASEFNSGF